jgi:hypothetical protein
MIPCNCLRDGDASSKHKIKDIAERNKLVLDLSLPTYNCSGKEEGKRGVLAAQEHTYAVKEHGLATGILDNNNARLAILARPSGLRCSSKTLWSIAHHRNALFVGRHLCTMHLPRPTCVLRNYFTYQLRLRGSKLEARAASDDGRCRRHESRVRAC